MPNYPQLPNGNDAPDRALVSWRTLKQLLKYIRAITPLEGRNVQLTDAAQGVHIHAPSPADTPEAPPDHPWKVTPNGDATVTVAAGSVMGFIPKGDGTITGPFALPMVQTNMDFSGDTLTVTAAGYIYAMVATTSTLENTAGPIPELGDDIIESHLHRPSAAPTAYFSTQAPAAISPSDSNVHFLVATVGIADSVASVTRQYLVHNPDITLDENLVIWG